MADTAEHFSSARSSPPYAYPGHHWELDDDGQPTDRIVDTRRRSDLITPVPKPEKRRQGRGQTEMACNAGDGLSTMSWSTTRPGSSLSSATT